MVVPMVGFVNEHQIPITHGILAGKLKKDSDEIDDTLSHLGVKGYLVLQFQNGKILFNIDGVFVDNSEKSLALGQSLFDLFESEFGRPPSQMELQRVVDWLKDYEQKLICYTLREALVYDHKSFGYIERILVEWKSRGMTAEKYEGGEH